MIDSAENIGKVQVVSRAIPPHCVTYMKGSTMTLSLFATRSNRAVHGLDFAIIKIEDQPSVCVTHKLWALGLRPAPRSTPAQRAEQLAVLVTALQARREFSAGLPAGLRERIARLPFKGLEAPW